LRETPATGPGFIIDTETSEVGEICDPGTTFLEGEWMPDNYFVYRVMQQDGGQSLRVLDVAHWTMQVLAESDPETGFAIFGWTPVEFSESE
jgi:hypothetical protein